MIQFRSSVMLHNLVFTILLLIFYIPSLFSQGKLKVEINNTNCPTSHHMADLWYFGFSAGIDFTGDEPLVLDDMWDLTAISGDAVVSDSLGNLLFYSDGLSVFNRNRQVMQNGANMAGNAGVTQPAVIVKKPGSNSIYYLFTVDIINLSPLIQKNGFSYSEIDMTGDGGLGAVKVKNKKLLPEVSSKVSAVLNSNMKDIWVMAHEWGSDRFVAFAVTESGVDTVGVSSYVGTVHSGEPNTNNFAGMMKFSHDGTKLGVAIYGMGIFELFNFDAQLGTLTELASGSGFDYAYGIEFSPNMEFMYGSTGEISGTGSSQLYQFPIGPNMFNSPYLVKEYTLADNKYLMGMQIASDGKIYIASAKSTDPVYQELGVIYNPDRPMAECNFNMLDGSETPFSLSPNGGGFGLPNFMQSYFDLPHFNIDSVCFQDSTQFRLRNEANITEINWDFGDGNIGNTLRPYHKYNNPGNYTVTVTETYNGQNYVYSEEITVQDLPFTELGDTLYMYKGNSIRLDAGGGFESYEWSTGESSSFITVNDTGTYWVALQNEKCCFSVDTVVVLLFDVYVPNAFRPGGANPVFRAIPTGGVEVEKFEFYVFNRWGQNVFKTQDISEGWDGKIDGQEAPGDVYMWRINYIVENDGKEQNIIYKGSVVLLR